MKRTIFLSILGIVFSFTSIKAQWAQTGGPTGSGGGAFSAKGQYLFAGNGWGQGQKGILRSSDNSKWDVINNELSDEYVTTFATNNNYIFAGTYSGGIYRSSDSGSSWKPINTGVKNKAIYYLGYFGKYLYTSTRSSSTNQNYVYRSSDNGDTWSSALKIGYTGAPLTYMTSIDTLLFATSQNSVYISSNGGTIWNDITPSINSGFWALTSLGNMLFTGSLQLGGIFRSSDNGKTWVLVNTKITGVTSLAVKDGKIFAADGFRLYVSSDSGITWTQIQGVFEPTSVAVLGNSILTGDGLSPSYLSTDNGSSWNAFGLKNGYVFSIISVGTHLISGEFTQELSHNSGAYFLYVSVDEGNTWLLSSDIYNTILCSIGSIIFGGSNGGGDGIISSSTDFGKSWQTTHTWKRGTNNGYNFPNALFADGTTLYMGTEDDTVNSIVGDGVLRSDDSGKTWIVINNGLSNHNVYDFASVGSNVFAATHGGVFRTSDKGISWLNTITGLELDTVYHFATIGSNIFAAGTGGVFFSNDNGESWSPRNTGLPKGISIALTVSGTNIIVACMDGTYKNLGIFLSSDNGMSWKYIGSGLGNEPVVGFAQDNSYIYAATYGASIWRRPLSELTVTLDPSAKIPSEISLEQNYPNPFFSSTSISFSLPHAEDITLQIFNELGNQVASLANGHFEAGKYHSDWDAGKMPAGVYYCRLQAGSVTKTRNIILSGS